MAYIEVIQHEAAEGRLKEIYDDLVEKRGQLAEVHKIQSLNPESIVKHMELYMHVMFGKSPLRRAQREMIATIVSKTNNCEYCVNHHGSALNHFWKDDERLAAFIANYETVGLSDMDVRLCRFAEMMTARPWEMSQGYFTELKDAGFTDRQVLDAMLVIAYFNFVNRMVLGLGVDLEEDRGTGYHYD